MGQVPAQNQGGGAPLGYPGATPYQLHEGFMRVSIVMRYRAASIILLYYSTTNKLWLDRIDGTPQVHQDFYCV